MTYLFFSQKELCNISVFLFLHGAKPYIETCSGEKKGLWNCFPKFDNFNLDHVCAIVFLLEYWVQEIKFNLMFSKNISEIVACYLLDIPEKSQQKRV